MSPMSNVLPRKMYGLSRDLHMFAGLFISPFVLLFAVSVFFLVHRWLPGGPAVAELAWQVTGLAIPPGLEQLSGRARIDALQSLLKHMSVHGEIGWVQYHPKEHRLVFPVSVPGREQTVTLDLVSGQATVESRRTGLADALISLHKAPGPHLVGMRMNWMPMKLWRWFADGTVYLLLLTTLSGIYLWWTLKSERRVGAALLVAGFASFTALVYALVIY